MTQHRQYNPRRGRWNSPDPFFHVLNGNLQSSTAAILQSANLFVFTMNNPIMWIDPSGLSATTSDLFNLTQNEIRALGGSFGTNSSGISSITFGNTTFRPDGTYQVNGGSRHSVYSHGSDFITDTVMRGGSEMVMLGGHGAFGQERLGLHTYVLMFITSGSRHWDTEYFYRNRDNEDNIRTVLGLQFATLGGGTEGSPMLRSIGNRPTDLQFDNKILSQHLYSGDSAIDRLMAAHINSQGHPGFLYGASGFISNNLLSGLLHATGLHPGELAYTAIGWDSPVPSSFFEPVENLSRTQRFRSILGR